MTTSLSKSIVRTAARVMAVIVFALVVIAGFHSKVGRGFGTLSFHQEQTEQIIFTQISSVSASQFIQVFQTLHWVYTEVVLNPSLCCGITPSFPFNFISAGAPLYNSICINAP